jgi:hypothetical protein
MNTQEQPFRRRSDADKALIESRIQPTTYLQGVFDRDNLEAITRIFRACSFKTKKNTGPLTLDIPPSWWEQENAPFGRVWKTVQKHVGKDSRIFSALIFATSTPHIIHNDDSFTFPKCWKGINIPLSYTLDDFCDHPIGTPELVFFDQYYLEGPAKFFYNYHGGSQVIRNYNDPVFQYSSVKGIRGNIYNPDQFRYQDYPWAERELGHIQPAWLSGLSVETKTPWEVGSASVFSTVRLHCATDFRNYGVRTKLALSIFTEKD